MAPCYPLTRQAEYLLRHSLGEMIVARSPWRGDDGALPLVSRLNYA